MASKQAIDSFLSCRRIAVVGVSRECAEAGVKRVWMHRGAGQGAVSPEAVALCRERGIEVVDGECPFMFLPDRGWFHGVHRFLKRLGGRLPS